jgi:MFS family permease
VSDETSAGQGLGPLTFPVLVSFVIGEWGWRAGWLSIGIAAFVLLFPLAFTVRTRPEDMGLQPDGEDAPARASFVPRPRHGQLHASRGHANRRCG